MSFIKKNDWEIALKEQAVMHCKRIPEICADESNFKVTTSTVEELIGNINGCERISNLSSTSISNINSGFGWSDKYGEKLGFIDTGVLFKKGKSGVLFCKNGIIIKPVMGSGNTMVDFHTMCSSIVEDSGYYIVAENKFLVKDELGVSVIDATSVMLKRFVGIREILLSQSEEHRKCFCDTTEKLVGNTLDKILEGSYDGADSKAKLLYRFCKDTISELSDTVSAIRSVLYALNNDFENASKYASESGDEELENLIKEKIEEYNRVLAGELYERAKAEYEEGKYFQSLKSANDSIHKLATTENWQLYFDSLYMSATEKSQYNHVILETFKSPNVDKSDAKLEIIAKESGRIAELEKKYKEYISTLSERIPEKVMEEDIDFFNDNPEFITVTDKYGMNAVMYAVLFGKEDLYNEINDHYPLNTKTNVLGHNINAIAAFGSVNAGDGVFLSVWKKYNKSFKDRLEKFRSDMKWAERKEKFADFSSSVADSAYRSAINSGNYSAAAQSIDVSASAESFKREAVGTADKIEHEFYSYLASEYKNVRRKAVATALKYVQSELLEVTEKPKIPELSEVENEPEFISLLNVEKTKYIDNYLSVHLTPKGEFEKTVQYEERTEKVNREAVEEFENNSNIYKNSCYNAYVAKIGEGKQSAEKTNLKIELARIYFKSLLSSKISLGTYNADDEVFEILCEDFSSVIAVPIDVAAGFKQCYVETGLDYLVDGVNINMENNCVKLKYACRAEYKNVSYPFTFIFKSK